MFTGIIEEIGIVKAVQHGSKSVCLTIGAHHIIEDMKTGDSINTNGVCLTVVSFNQIAFSVDVIPESIRRSNIKELKAGSKVNLERALKLNDRLGGHLVTGHIDGTGVIRKIWEEDNALWYSITGDPAVIKYIVEKGSVAIDGISLTVANVGSSSFDVSVIPHTQKVTIMQELKTGDIVNIECDIMAKYCEKLTTNGRDKGNITLEFLAEQGFI